MDGGADQNALAHLSGKLKDRMGNEGSGFFVQKLVFCAIQINGSLFVIDPVEQNSPRRGVIESLWALT